MDQLIGGKRPAELLAFERIGPRRLETGLGRPHRAPANAVARVIEAAKRALEFAHELFVFAELAVEIEWIVPGEGSRGHACLCHLLFSPALRPNAGSRTQGIFRSNFERVLIERYQRLVAGATGAAGCPLGAPKKRKKSDFGLMTIRVSPPFNPAS